MKTRSVLLYVPAVPFTLTALTPQRELALACSSLAESGHETEIWDLGTLDELGIAQQCIAGAPRRALRFWGRGMGATDCAVLCAIGADGYSPVSAVRYRLTWLLCLWSLMRTCARLWR